MSAPPAPASPVGLVERAVTKNGMNNSLIVCYCDFDGCLHDDAVYIHPKKGIYMRTPGKKLFEWMPILEELLENTDVKIVLSTSWVRMKSFRFAKSMLSEKLKRRVIGATFHNRVMRKDEFDNISRGYQIKADVDRRKPDYWFAIDNDEAGWPEHLRQHLVITQDRLGLSEKRVQEQIKELLTSIRAD